MPARALKIQQELKMKITKVLLSLIAAEIFCLFISIPFAGSANPLMRAIGAFCMVGILCVLLANMAMNAARDDKKQERITGEPINKAAVIGAGLFASVPALASWIVLLISVSGGKFDYYKWHKLINAPFLQVYNLIESDASSAALSTGEVMLMLPFVFLPAAVVLTVYALTCKGVITLEK